MRRSASANGPQSALPLSAVDQEHIEGIDPLHSDVVTLGDSGEQAVVVMEDSAGVNAEHGN